MTILRLGATQKYANNWDSAFGEGKPDKSAAKKSAKKAAPQAAAPKKKAATKSATGAKAKKSRKK